MFQGGERVDAMYKVLELDFCGLIFKERKVGIPYNPPPPLYNLRYHPARGPGIQHCFKVQTRIRSSK